MLAQGLLGSSQEEETMKNPKKLLYLVPFGLLFLQGCMATYAGIMLPALLIIGVFAALFGFGSYLSRDKNKE